MPHFHDFDEWPLRPKQEPTLHAYRVTLTNGTDVQFDAHTLHAARDGALAFQRDGNLFASVAAGAWSHWEMIGDA